MGDMQIFDLYPEMISALAMQRRFRARRARKAVKRKQPSKRWSVRFSRRGRRSTPNGASRGGDQTAPTITNRRGQRNAPLALENSRQQSTRQLKLNQTEPQDGVRRGSIII